MRMSDWSSDVCSSDLHKIPPHCINYRANLWALHQAGVKSVIAIAAVGAMAPWFTPGEIAVPSDLIDYSHGREHTYSDGTPASGLHHVEFTEPYTPALRRCLLDAAAQAAVPLSRSEEHTSELQSLMRISYAVFCLKQ